jgi:hypothetical protein
MVVVQVLMKRCEQVRIYMQLIIEAALPASQEENQYHITFLLD